MTRASLFAPRRTTHGNSFRRHLAAVATVAALFSATATGQSAFAEAADAAAPAVAGTVPAGIKKVLDYEIPHNSCGRSPLAGVADPNIPEEERQRRGKRYNKCIAAYHDQLVADQKDLNEVTKNPVPAEYADAVKAKLIELAQKVASTVPQP